MESPTVITCELFAIEELSKFKCGTVMRCHLLNKSVYKISPLLDIPWSTVSSIIGKWKHLATHPWSRRPHKVTERCHRML